MTSYDIYVNGQFILSKPNRKEADDWITKNECGTEIFEIKVKKSVK